MNFIDYVFEHTKNSDNILVLSKDTSLTYQNIWNGIIGVSEWLKKKIGSKKK